MASEKKSSQEQIEKGRYREICVAYMRDKGKRERMRGNIIKLINVRKPIENEFANE